MGKVGVGIVGVGEMGLRHAENILRLSSQASLVAIADASPERAAKVAGDLGVSRSFGSLEALLACNEVQAVVLATPDKFHAEAISMVAAAGKDMLCEKPIALSVPDAKAALAAVEKAGVRLQIGFMRRFDPAYRGAMDRIEAGDIGEPVMFKSLGRDKDAPPMSYYKSGLSGMMFYNASIHDFDLARWLMRDEVVEVQTYATVAIRPEVAEYGDIIAGMVNLKYQKGAIGNVECYVQACYGYDVRTEVVGSQGSILIGNLAQTPVAFLAKEGRISPTPESFLIRFADAYLAEMSDFINMVATDRDPVVNGLDGLRALEIAVAAERSYLDSKPVAV